MLIVVGGHSRKIGKTSLMTRVIEAFPRHDWTAVKISRNRHGGDSRLPFLLDEECDPTAIGDAARYLRAGARRSYWLRAADDRLALAAPLVESMRASEANLIVESNRLLDCVSPDLFLVVLDPSTPDFKDSTRRNLGHADALALVERETGVMDWSGVVLPSPGEAPRLPISPVGSWGSELEDFLTGRIGEATAAGGGAAVSSPRRRRTVSTTDSSGRFSEPGRLDGHSRPSENVRPPDPLERQS